MVYGLLQCDGLFLWILPRHFGVKPSHLVDVDFIEIIIANAGVTLDRAAPARTID